MLNRLFPREVDKRFEGHRAALWLLGLFVAVKVPMSLNSIFNTAAVAAGADGMPLDRFGPAGARAVLMLFALMALGQLALAIVALAALVRWRSLVPFLFLVLLSEQLARRFIVASYEVERTGAASFGWYLNMGIVAALALGLVLSLIPTRRSKEQER